MKKASSIYNLGKSASLFRFSLGPRRSPLRPCPRRSPRRSPLRPSLLCSPFPLPSRRSSKRRRSRGTKLRGVPSTAWKFRITSVGFSSAFTLRSFFLIPSAYSSFASRKSYHKQILLDSLDLLRRGLLHSARSLLGRQIAELRLAHRLVLFQSEHLGSGLRLLLLHFLHRARLQRLRLGSPTDKQLERAVLQLLVHILGVAPVSVARTVLGDLTTTNQPPQPILTHDPFHCGALPLWRSNSRLPGRRLATLSNHEIHLFRTASRCHEASSRFWFLSPQERLLPLHHRGRQNDSH